MNRSDGVYPAAGADFSKGRRSATVLPKVLTNKAQNLFFETCEHLEFLQSFSILELRELSEKVQGIIGGDEFMECKNAQTIVNEIGAHIQKQGGAVSSWYAGITEDIDARLFGAHRVPRKGHWYSYRQGISADAGRSAEKALLNWGCDGGSGGGDDDAVFVYAYLKATKTDP